MKRLSIFSILLLLSYIHTNAATKTWDGGGSDNNWQTAANWDSDIAPSAGDVLIFTGSSRTTSNNDFASNTSFSSLTFDASASAFTLTGNSIILTGGASAITNSHATNNMIIELNITFSTAAPTITVASGGITMNGTIANGGFIVSLSQTGAISFNGVISGTGSVTSNGSGKVTFSATNTFSGGVIMSTTSATFETQNTSGFGTGTVIFNRSGTLNLKLDGSGSNSDINFTNNILVNDNASNLTVTVVLSNNGSGNTNNRIIFTQLSFRFGTMNFSASNNYSAKFLLIQHQSSSGTGLFCTLSCSMPAEVVDWTSTDDSNFHQLSNTDASNSGILSGTVSDGTAATHMYYSGSKTWTVTSSTNNYTGNTTISSGTTTVSGSNAIIPNSSATTITGTWDMAGYSETVGSITGAGTIDIVSAGGTSTLTTGENNTSTTFSGTIKNTTGTLSLTKTGSGTLTLTGTNTFSGDATISAGTLAIGSGSTSGSITNNIVNNSALIMNRSNTLTYAGVIAGTGTLTKLGAGTLSLTGGNTFSGDLTISAGAVSLGTGSTSGTVASNIVNNSALIVNRSNAISYGGVISGTGTLTKQAAGTLTLTNNNTYSGTTTLTDGTIEYGTSNAITASSIILNGGTLSTGSTSGYSSTTTGTLSLTNNSTINLGSGSHTLAFAASNGATWTSGKTLTINGWSGNFDGTAGTGGIIKTGSSAELSASILNQIQFFRASNSTNYPATQLANGEIVPTVVLPVLYSSFTIKKLHDINIIYWSTTIEVNNANFDIERSFDGVTFEIIGNVKGKGNTTTTTNYEFIDHKINTKKPIYYRLKQIDNDGKYAYSAIKLVKNTSVANPIKIFPNPIQGESKLYATFDDEAETVEISLYDLSGRLVQYLTINNIKPNETYELNKDNLALQKGEYILHLITSNDEYSEKIEVK